MLPYKVPKSELRRNVHLPGIVVDFGEYLHIIRDAVIAHKIDAKADLILRHDLLPGDLHPGEPRVHKVHVYPDIVFPEVIGAGVQNADQLLVKVQPCFLILGHLHFCINRGGKLCEYVLRHILRNLGRGDIHKLVLVTLQHRPEGVFAAAEHSVEFSACVVKRQLLVRNFADRGQFCDLAVCEKGVQFAFCRYERLLQRDDLNFPGAEQRILSCAQKLYKPSVMKQETLLILIDNNLFHIKNLLGSKFVIRHPCLPGG